MLSEVVFAAASAVTLGAATLTLRTIAGGALIVAAAAMAAYEPSART
jgi:drug/metabolite transporter (DMT)-like permease